MGILDRLFKKKQPSTERNSGLASATLPTDLSEATGGKPEGAKCANHPDLPSVAVCRYCGRALCSNCLAPDARLPCCQNRDDCLAYQNSSQMTRPAQQIQHSPTKAKALVCPDCGVEMYKSMGGQDICPQCGKQMAKQSPEGVSSMWPLFKKNANEKGSASDEAQATITQMKSIPEQYQKELVDPFTGPGGAVVRTIGTENSRLSCLFLVLPKNHFRVDLSPQTRIKVRFALTQTPYDRAIISSCIQVFDSPKPGIDEHFHVRDEHLERMTAQEHTYLVIADTSYRIYFSRRIPFDSALKEDMNNIQKAFQKYGREKEHPTIGDDPKQLQALQWYQSNVNMQELMRRYF
jgi:hypothetical protein